MSRCPFVIDYSWRAEPVYCALDEGHEGLHGWNATRTDKPLPTQAECDALTCDCVIRCRRIHGGDSLRPHRSGGSVKHVLLRHLRSLDPRPLDFDAWIQADTKLTYEEWRTTRRLPPRDL